ncbi:uncharacterized protein LOC129576404 [Sitodiplosis mosellana]|uniref:uncharacterized protein LOC129576404 n=1 Tax=Sitodiplosis mosellana TaxID=263140 RepID=UPI002444CC90|nr:uncharacterized protein LOC129576404 [Sitodiplosis mosellana]
MDASVLAATSPSNDLRWPVVRISRKEVRDYQQQQNMSSKTRTTTDVIDWKKDADIRDSNNMQPRVILDRSSVPHGLTDSAQPSTSGMKKSTASTSKTTSTSRAKPKLAVKKPTKAGRPQFVMNFRTTRSKKN